MRNFSSKQLFVDTAAQQLDYEIKIIHSMYDLPYKITSDPWRDLTLFYMSDSLILSRQNTMRIGANPFDGLPASHLIKLLPLCQKRQED